MGQYGVANNLINTGRSFISPISDSIYPYLVKNKNYKLVKKLLLILEPIIIFGCLVLYFFAGSIIKIICGNGYEDSIPVLRAMLPLVVITLPTYLCGFPLLGAIGKIKYANISTIIGAIFHALCLVFFYCLGILNFVSISLLTFCTELIVLSIRLYVVISTLKRGKNENN